MDFYIAINRNDQDEKIILKKDYIKSVSVKFDSPDDSFEKASAMGAEIKITGKLDQTISDDTKKLSEWALISSGEKGVYREVDLKAVAEGYVKKQYIFNYAFLVDYSEEYSESGEETFKLFLKQKKDKVKEIKIVGSYEFVEEEEE